MGICKQKLLEKNIKREKKTGRPHFKNLKNVFCLNNKINCFFFFSFFRPNIPTDKPAICH